MSTNRGHFRYSFNGISKVCSKCLSLKWFHEFAKDKHNPDQLATWCKGCRLISDKARYASKPEWYKKQHRSYYDSHKEQILESIKRYSEEHREHLASKAKEYRQIHKDHFREVYKKWEAKNRDRVNSYQKNRRNLHPEVKLAHYIRTRMTKILGNKKPLSSSDALGCSFNELKVWIEKQFEPGMTWDNRGLKGWHIDHIKPLSSFCLTDPDQFAQACHFTNLKPMWWFDNLSKGKKMQEALT